MRVRSGPVLLSLLLTAVLATTILLTRGPAPTAAAPEIGATSEAEAVAAAPRTPATTTPPCENGTVVPNPAANPGLVADCSVLLAVKDTLRGAATLNWDAGRAITAWEGITVEGTPPRVTRLRLVSRGLSGRLPAQLGDLPALRDLRLGHNRLTGPIPAALGAASALWYLQLDDNQLTGPIPPALGSLAALVVLRLDGNALTGAIPPELGSLPALGVLRLYGNDSTGPIPPALGSLTTLWELRLDGNRLRGAIPPALGALTRLWELRLSDNRLTGAIPAALGALPALRQLYLAGNAGLTGCVPPALRDVRAHDLARLGLADCAPGAPRSLTVTATGGGRVSPDGTTTQAGGAAVTLTANWNDATHTFTGWGGDCGGTVSTCTLTMDANKSVTATFAALAADRCATTTAADCIRAVYKGAPEDYAQVADIPADAILTPGADGRYQVERGQQITVVTAARLPAGYTRFYLQRRDLQPPAPVTGERLIKPLGTTYTFTAETDERRPTRFTYDLRPARPRPRPRLGQKPELGDVVVTTVFQVKTTTMRYTSYDTTGAATTAGSYAFLTGSGDDETAVATYEGLRDGTTTGLRIHQSDGYGASQADTYSAVAVGDIFEWRQADDCWVRYQVMEVKADPAGATTMHFAVRWVTYTWTGCTGTIATDTRARVRMDPPPVTGPEITSPVRHGPYLLHPQGWSGDLGERTQVTVPTPGGSDGSATARSDDATPQWPSDDPAVVRQHPLWRDPDLPDGWTLLAAEGERGDAVPGGTEIFVRADYRAPEGSMGLETIVRLLEFRPAYLISSERDMNGYVYETRMIDGHAALLWYTTEAVRFSVTVVQIFDEATSLEYVVAGTHPHTRDIETAIAIARSLYR